MAFKKKIMSEENKENINIDVKINKTDVVSNISDSLIFNISDIHTRVLDCEIKFVKTHPEAILPTKAHEGDNCWDIYAVEDKEIPPTQGISRNGVISTVNIGNAIVDVGLTLGDITPGYGFVFKPRSGLGFKHGIYPHQGEIDNEFRGNLAVKMYNFTGTPYQVKKGDRICQFKVEKIYNTAVEFADTITEAVRGINGFGSTGK